MVSVDIIHGDCVDVLPDYRNKVDLILTSPPYGDMRTYEGNVDKFDFARISWRCKDALKPNGIMVWIVGDQSVDKSLTLDPMRQAIFFKDTLGMQIIDIMVYEKSWQMHIGRKYLRAWEYMFVMARGNDYTFNPIMDRKNTWAGWEPWGKLNKRNADGTMREAPEHTRKPIPEYGRRNNIWRYATGWGNTTEREWQDNMVHPAMFPLKLAVDHIESWTNPGDLVLDPMCGGGTTLKAAQLTGRNAVGIEVEGSYVDLIKERLVQRSLM